jgi:hypothetical protein
MAAGNFTVYGLAKEAALEGLIDFDTDTFVAILVTSSYTPSVNADDTYSDVSANELPTAGGYTAGGQVISPLTVSHSAGTVTVDSATNPSWGSSTLTAKYLVVVRRAGGSLVAGDLLVGYVDLNDGGGSVSTVAGTLSVTWNASGIFTLA